MAPRPSRLRRSSRRLRRLDPSAPRSSRLRRSAASQRLKPTLLLPSGAATDRSDDGRKGPVHDVRHAPQRGRPHRGRAAVRLLTQRRYCSRLERRGVVGVVGVRLLHHVAWNTRPQTVAHSTQKLDSRTPAVIKAMQASFDPCIVCQISSLLGATDQHSTTQSSYLCVSVDSNMRCRWPRKVNRFGWTTCIRRRRPA